MGTQDRLRRVGEDRLKDRTLQTDFTKIEEEDRLHRNRRGEKTALTETGEKTDLTETGDRRGDWRVGEK